ncbi:MAG: polyamine aminopropyltransferase [Alphaproteobacteria bacterium]
MFTRQRLIDGGLILVLALIAGAGLVYEYLLSHYAGRVLGLMEHAIFAMIGVMIVSMGVGAFLARFIKDPHLGFALLEVLIAVLGATSILAMAGAFALAEWMPAVLSETYRIPQDLIPRGGLHDGVARLAEWVPFALGFVLGALVGMEIPLIARAREALYGGPLAHNAGTVYGADYVGAGLGAALFVLVFLSIAPERGAVYAALINLAAGSAFLVLRWQQLRWRALLVGLHGAALLLCAVLYLQAGRWHENLEDMLYADQVVFAAQTPFQRIVLTRNARSTPIDYRLYLNGRLQFSSIDERLYHEMLVHPAMAASARHDHVLLVGGGDGLALREILKWEPKKVTVLELDEGMVDLFAQANGPNAPLLDLNARAFSDSRVSVRLGDAFNSVQALANAATRFDVIIVDLPDPSHPDLNKLYSLRFYAGLREVLAGDGVMNVQSTSPYHARDAFLTVGVTLQAAGFGLVQPLHVNVPSFGEWGFWLAAPQGQPLIKRWQDMQMPKVTHLSPAFLRAATVFPLDFLAGFETMEPNRLGNGLMVQLHGRSWLRGETRLHGESDQ